MFCLTEAAESQRCGLQCWAVPNYTLYCVTHPSYTSNIGPTARIFSCYVDVVPVVQWVIFPQTDERLFVILVNGQHDVLFLSSSWAGKGFSVSS